MGKTLPELLGDDLPEVGRVQGRGAPLLDVATVLDSLENLGVGRGAADAFLFELLDQRGFVEARRGFRKLLQRRNVKRGQQVSHRHRRQQRLDRLGDPGHTLEAVEDLHAACGLQHRAGRLVVSFEQHRGRFPLCITHLARHEPLPDQVVQPELVLAELPLQALRRAADVGRADRLVSLLGVGTVRFIDPDRLGTVLRTVFPLDHLPRRLDRLGRQVSRVGSHVGDQSADIAAGQGVSLVQPLCGPHRAIGREAQEGRRGTLQSAGAERLLWLGVRGLGRDVRDTEAGVGIDPTADLQADSSRPLGLLVIARADLDIEQPHRLGCRDHLVGEVPGRIAGTLELEGAVGDQDQLSRQAAVLGNPRQPLLPGGPLALLVSNGLELGVAIHQPGRGCGILRQHRGDLPRLVGHMSPDQLLTVDNQHHRHALDPPGRESSGDLLPQQRRDLVADDAVENASSLLRVDHVHVDRARRLEGAVDGLLGHRVEDHPLEPLRRQVQFLGQVPGNRLALAVQVRRQPDVFARLGHLLEFPDHLLLAVDRDVERSEVVVEIDAGDRQVHPLGIASGQIADVSHRRLDLVLRTQVLVDRLRLGRRFDDHQVPYSRSC